MIHRIVRRAVAVLVVAVAAVPASAQFPLSLRSSDGSEIILEAPPERIIAYDSAVVETLFAIGEGERLVATHDFVSYPPETASIPRIGDRYQLDLEAAVALEPDLVVLYFDAFLPDLKRAGLTVLYRASALDDFTQLADRIRLWGAITGNPDAAESVARRFEERIAAVEALLAATGTGPRVFQDVGDFWTPGAGTLVQHVFELLKLENVALPEVTGYAQLSPEIVAARDPQVIIARTPDVLRDHPGLQQVQAVRNDAFCVPESDALDIAGPRFVEGIESLARCVYPDLFE